MASVKVGDWNKRDQHQVVPSWAPEGIRGTFVLLSFPSTPHSVPSEGDKNSAWAVNVWSVMWTLTIPSLQMEEAKQGVVVRHRQQIKGECQKLPRMLCTCFGRLYKTDYFSAKFKDECQKKRTFAAIFISRTRLPFQHRMVSHSYSLFSTTDGSISEKRLPHLSGGMWTSLIFHVVLIVTEGPHDMSAISSVMCHLSISPDAHSGFHVQDTDVHPTSMRATELCGDLPK